MQSLQICDDNYFLIYDAIAKLETVEGDKAPAITALYDQIAEKAREVQKVVSLTASIKQAAGRGYGDIIRESDKRARKAVMARVKAELAKTHNFTQLSTLPDGISEQLDIGRFIVTDMGIEAPASDDSAATYSITAVPLIPVQILTNHLTKIVSVRLAYVRDMEWRMIMADMGTLSNRHSIVSLAAYGMGITSANAETIIAYLMDAIENNPERIPHAASTSQLGWTRGEGFIPYTGDIIYDGTDESLRRVFEAVATGGSEDEWMAMARQIRRDPNSPARLYMAASFAAPLIERLGLQCSFVHLWGTTQFGKTVSLLLAASIWGNPAEGALLHSLSSTNVGMTLVAGTLKNLPVCLDEAESIKDKAHTLQNTIYTLSQGMSKSKGAKYGGMAQGQSWRTLFLTNGESPLTDSDSNGGAVNRVLNIRCDKPLFDDPRAVAECCRSNYGWAGANWIAYIAKLPQDELKKSFLRCVDELKAISGASGKQLDLGALLLLTEELITPLLFGDDPIDPHAIARYLVSMQDMDVNRRALDMIRDWIATNQANVLDFRKAPKIGDIDCSDVAPPHLIGRWLDEGHTEIALIPAELKAQLALHGFSYDAFIAAMDEGGRINRHSENAQAAVTSTQRLGNQSVRCLCLRVSEEQSQKGEQTITKKAESFVQSAFEL